MEWIQDSFEVSSDTMRLTPDLESSTFETILSVKQSVVVLTDDGNDRDSSCIRGMRLVHHIPRPTVTYLERPNGKPPF